MKKKIQCLAFKSINNATNVNECLHTLEYSKEKFEDKNPTFAARDNLTNPDLGYFTRSFEPQRGDVVLVVDPKNSNNYLIKRIIGLEGDTIVPLGFNQVEREPLKLKKDQVWVESDAGYGYRDSNIFGPVHIKSIQGRDEHYFCFWSPG